MKLKTIVFLVAVCFATAGPTQGLIMQVGEASQIIVAKSIEALRDRGIIKTKDDFKRAEVIESHREGLLKRMRDLAAYENGYRRVGNADRVSQIQQELKIVKNMYKFLPVATEKDNYTKAMNYYYKNIAPKAVERSVKIDTALKTYKTEVKPEYKEGGTRPSGETGSEIKGGQIGNLEIFVQSITGDAIVYINGKKVSAKTAIPISGEGAFLISVKGNGQTRKMIEGFKGGPNTEIREQDEDNLCYTVQSGSFKASTDIHLKEDEADFLITKQPNIHAQWHEVGKNKLKITFDGAFSIGISIEGKTTWNRHSVRTAKTVNDQVVDDFRGTILIQVTGRG